MAAVRHVSMVTKQSRQEIVRTFVEREASDLLAYFVRRTVSAEDAADMLSETLLVIWRKEGFIPSNATEARMWMFGVARKVLSGHRRTRIRQASLRARLADELTTAQADPSQPWVDEVRAAISHLTEIDREIVRLVYWDGFSLNQTAQILRMRPGTVRSRHHRARARLRALLGEDEG